MMQRDRTCGIIQCPGCNNSFDKSIVFEAIRDRFPGIRLEWYSRLRQYNIVVIINGCTKDCTVPGLEAPQDAVSINDPDDVKRLMTEIERTIT